MGYDPLFSSRIENCFNSKGTSWRSIKMMGGICYLVKDKMCVGTYNDKDTGQAILIARVGEDFTPLALEETPAEPFAITGRESKAFVTVKAIHLQDDLDLHFWIDKCLIYNPKAKSSKKK